MEMGELDEPLVFGEWLKSRRKSLDLTQAELAERAGCSPAGLRKIEAGERRPSKELAALLATALEIAPERRAAFVRVARGELNLERLGSPLASPPSSPPCATALPIWPTPFIGRDGELNALGELLCDHDCRLLTLIGPGGIGKTRLAVEVAARAAGDAGTCFVSLAQVSHSSLVVPAIADALGLAFQGQIEARFQLLNYLQAKRLVLLLDNVEHLLDGVDLLAEIIARSPGVKLLVTSRERLNLQGEWVYEIAGLPVPPAAGENAETYSSFALFVQSARRARAGFVLRPEDRPAVVGICRILEGAPLGIELAAAWVFTLSPSEIARRIEQNLDFLETTFRDVPERQRSLRAAFNHSWSLLPDEERYILSRLAVFRGGFELDAAEQIASASAAALLALASKSLVRRGESGRYDLHEVVRQYAFSHLAEDPQMDATRDRHSSYYLALLRDSESALKGAAQADALRRLTEESGNVRAAWAGAVEQERFDLIGPALRSLGWLSEVNGNLAEGINDLDMVIRPLLARQPNEVERRALALALGQKAMLRFRKGQFDLAMPLFDRSLEIARPLGDPALLVDPLILSGIILHSCGDYKGALERVLEGGACAEAAGDEWYAIYARFNQGYITGLTGRYGEGYELMRDSLEAWRAMGDPHSISLALNFLTPATLRLGAFEEARANLEESIALCAAADHRWGLGTAYRFLGQTALAQGRIDEAKTHVHKSLEVFQDIVVGWDIVLAQNLLGACAAAEGDAVAAERLFRDALHGAIAAQTDGLALDALVGLSDSRLRDGRAQSSLALALIVVEHQAATRETAARAGELRRLAGERLTVAERAAAQAWGRGLTLAEIVRSLDHA
jgi:predicted ATPase/transcriptional regulator with XRE-family HTH domain